jgi:uncharacterized caspase-like protein
MALCIGVSSYGKFCSILPDLGSGPLNDCNDVAGQLTKLGFDCRTLDDEKASIERIQSSLQDLVDIAMQRHLKLLETRPNLPQPLVLFYFAGHGMQGIEGLQYLVPYLQRRVENENIYVCLDF